jgi:hypothetical protein
MERLHKDSANQADYRVISSFGICTVTLLHGFKGDSDKCSPQLCINREENLLLSIDKTSIKKLMTPTLGYHLFAVL